MFEGRPCLGWLPLREGRLSDIVWLTYGQLYAKSLQFGSGLRSLVDQVGHPWPHHYMRTMLDLYVDTNMFIYIYLCISYAVKCWVRSETLSV